jgi:hypothetical protein
VWVTAEGCRSWLGSKGSLEREVFGGVLVIGSQV